MSVSPNVALQELIQDFADGGRSREHWRLLFALETSKISRFFKLDNFQKMLKAIKFVLFFEGFHEFS